MNNNGPKIDPCGTPLRTCKHFDTLPFKTIFCCLPCNHSAFHRETLPLIPCASNLFTQLNSTQLTTPKEKEWSTRGKKL